MENSKKIYFAGELFDLKDLVGNKLMAQAIERAAMGRYKCLLPQDIRHKTFNSKAMRDTNISALLSCDMAIFNYDACDVDSGTAVEFMFAKFADIPALLLRSDIRQAGDCLDAKEKMPWNLMSSHYPRTEILVLNSAEIYAKHEYDYEDAINFSAQEVVKKLDTLSNLNPLMPDSMRKDIFKWIPMMADLDTAQDS